MQNQWYIWYKWYNLFLTTALIFKVVFFYIPHTFLLCFFLFPLFFVCHGVTAVTVY